MTPKRVKVKDFTELFRRWLEATGTDELTFCSVLFLSTTHQVGARHWTLLVNGLRFLPFHLVALLHVSHWKVAYIHRLMAVRMMNLWALSKEDDK